MTQEQRAAIMYAQTCLRRIALQLERDLGMDPASEMAEAISAAVRVCDDAMRPPCERRPTRAWWKLRTPAPVRPADSAASRQLAECRAVLKAIVDQLAG